MKEFTKILVATDFSDHASEAVQYGASLAKRYGVPLVLVHVYQPMTYAVPAGYMMHTGDQLTDMMHLFQSQLDAAEQDALAAGAPEVKGVLPVGTAAREIVATARAENCDLIVMGTQGRTGLGLMLMGSTAERVVRTADCAVLTVKSLAADANT
jgi:nucleotide-binding universal stress UspA family protein